MKRKERNVTTEEVRKLLEATRKTKHAIRDKLIIKLIYKHGLRVSEVIGLVWQDVNLLEKHIYFRRGKGSNNTMHPIFPDEQKLLLRVHKQYTSNFVIAKDNGQPMVRENVNRLLRLLCDYANIPRINPHSLKHYCGYYLINSGVDIRVIQQYLGHRNIENTARYTKVDASQFNDFTLPSF